MLMSPCNRMAIAARGRPFSHSCLPVNVAKYRFRHTRDDEGRRHFLVVGHADMGPTVAPIIGARGVSTETRQNLIAGFRATTQIAFRAALDLAR